MRKFSVLRILFLVLLIFDVGCKSAWVGSQDPTTRQLNDAKSALVLSAHLYDGYMKAMASRYQEGACDDMCKARTIAIANVYLTAARAMKVKLDAGRVDIATDYQTIFDTISQLYGLVRDAGANVQPNALPPANTFNALVVPQGAITWPPATLQRPPPLARYVSGDLVRVDDLGVLCIADTREGVTCWRRP